MLAARGIDAEVDEHEVTTQEEAERLALPRLAHDPRRRPRRRPGRRRRPTRADLPHLPSSRRARVARPDPRATGGGPAYDPGSRHGGTGSSTCPAWTGRTTRSTRTRTRRRSSSSSRATTARTCRRGRTGSSRSRATTPIAACGSSRSARTTRSSYPEDSFEEMKARSAARGFTFDYLYDEPQAFARALGAERTPEVFLFDGERRLVYHGAIDDDRDEAAAQPALPARRARRGAVRAGAAGPRDAGRRLQRSSGSSPPRATAARQASGRGSAGRGRCGSW